MTRNDAASRQQAEDDIDDLIRSQGAENTEVPPAEEPAPAPEPQSAINTPEIPEDTPAEPPASELDTSQQEEHEREEWLYKQRYQALVGKYNKEVPRLHERVRQLEQQGQGHQAEAEELASLRMEVQRLRQQVAAPAAAPQIPAADIPGIDKLKEEYGESLVEGVTALVQAKLEQQGHQVAQRLDTVEKSAAQQQHDLFVTTLSATLSQSSIDLAEYNNDPLFNEWLSTPYNTEMSMHTPRHDLDEAVNHCDVTRAVAIFKRYVAGLGGTQNKQRQDPALQQHTQIADGGAGSELPRDQPYEFNAREFEEMGDKLRRGVITQAAFDEYEHKAIAALYAH